jgi:hypothetical protein
LIQSKGKNQKDDFFRATSLPKIERKMFRIKKFKQQKGRMRSTGNCPNKVNFFSVQKILEALADGTQQKSSSFRNEF